MNMNSSLPRITDSPVALNIKGSRFGTDSSGQNQYFASESQAGQSGNKDEAVAMNVEDVLVNSIYEEPLFVWNGRIPKVEFSTDSLHKVSESLVTSFLPFQVPFSLH